MDHVERWAASGAMALTGDQWGPPLAPPTSAAADVDQLAAPFGLDSSLLGERAALLGLSRRGRESCGGATRLLAAADGWLAVALPRPEDLESLPALLGAEPLGDAWPAVAAAVAERSAGEVAEFAALLGMAVAVVGESRRPFAVHGAARRVVPSGEPPARVIDLSALWAGPLCGHLLWLAGAEVIKVESTTRPDGARGGAWDFYELINQGKRSVALDFTSVDGRSALRRLVDSADVVISSSRSRAIQQLGIDPDHHAEGGTDRVWVAVTGHGWDVDRVGFGDDAAAAAALVAWGDDGKPRFAGDAIADPLCGAMAARAALDGWKQGGRWFIDASLVGAATSAVAEGPTLVAEPATHGGWSIHGARVAEPRHRGARATAVALGADTEGVLRSL